MHCPRRSSPPAATGWGAWDALPATSCAATLGKTMLGVGCFMPPPAGTICQVASVGVAVYENWDTISSVGKNVGEGIANAVKDPGKFVSDAADRVTDAGKSVAHFFGF